MKIKFDCGCSVKANPDGYGSVDATFLELCQNHRMRYVLKYGKKN